MQSDWVRHTPFPDLPESARLGPTFQPAPETGGVGVDAVHDIELFLVGGIDVAQERVESRRERIGNVQSIPKGVFGRLGPERSASLRLRPGVLGFTSRP